MPGHADTLTAAPAVDPDVRRPLFALAALAGAAGYARHRARGIPFCPLVAGSRVGADWPERRGVTGDPVAGEMDDLATYARPDFDPGRVDPAVRALYEHTADFEMTLAADWHRPFRAGAAVAARATSRLEQLNLPGPGEGTRTVESRLCRLDAPDPRDDPRLWVRTDRATGEAVFVAVYASHVRDGERLVNIAVPLPGANLSTVLRMRHLDSGLELTTDCPTGGLYLVTPVGAFALPASQRFRVYPGAHPDAPDAPDGRPADVLATQAMWLAGARFLTVRYAARR
ncbi:hypothetical protein [Halorarius halobius]|uniref:hypothetical protein n=1 Tax=Halorarius halobius TaxID=2962671 RepID=UPI0020CD4297|nr:hypothetical protein [Halorarius halobius]